MLENERTAFSGIKISGNMEELRKLISTRPYDHNDTEEIKERILTYFDECAKSGKPSRIEGLTNALDVSRMTLLNWQKDGESVGNS